MPFYMAENVHRLAAGLAGFRRVRQKVVRQLPHRGEKPRIRTPLHGIISFTELAYLKNNPLPRNHQRTILDLSYALLDIVNDTLDFSKIEAGEMDTDTAPFMPRYAKPDLRLPPAINAVGVDQYVEALEVRAVCHEMVALFGGRMPHVHGILAGGAAEIPTKEKLVE